MEPDSDVDRLRTFGRSRILSFVLIPLVVGAIEIGVTLLAAPHQPDTDPIDPLGILLLAIGPAALAVRDRFPGTVLVLASATKLLYWSLDYPRRDPNARLARPNGRHVCLYGSSGPATSTRPGPDPTVNPTIATSPA